MSAVATNIFKFTNANGVLRKIPLDLMKPTKQPDGRWFGAKIGKMQQARLRAECLDAGITEHPFTKPGVNNKPVVFKGQKHLIKKQKREDIITQKMKDMPTKLEEYYINLRARRVRAYDPLYIIRHGMGRMK